LFILLIYGIFIICSNLYELFVFMMPNPSGPPRLPPLESPSGPSSQGPQPGPSSWQPDGPPRSIRFENNTGNRPTEPVNINFEAIKNFLLSLKEKRLELLAEDPNRNTGRVDIIGVLNEPQNTEAKGAVVALCNSNAYTDKLGEHINKNDKIYAFTENKGLLRYTRMAFLLDSQADRGLRGENFFPIKKNFETEWNAYKASNNSID